MDGLKHQKEKRSMDHFAGLDVSVKVTSVCIVDDALPPCVEFRPRLTSRIWCSASI